MTFIWRLTFSKPIFYPVKQLRLKPWPARNCVVGHRLRTTGPNDEMGVKNAGLKIAESTFLRIAFICSWERTITKLY